MLHKNTTLYKYRRDNDHTLQLLQNQELYLSFPKDFNDPFDCRIVADFTGSNENSWKLLADRERIPEPLKNKALEGLQSLNFDPMKIKEVYEKYDSSMLVYCLSKVNDNVLMWGDYSNCHYGICIGFETTVYDDNRFYIKTNDLDLQHHPQEAFHNFLLLYKVQYSDKRPEAYNVFADQRNICTLLTNKASDWKHEQEYRILLPYKEINKKIIKFDKSVLKQIIIGYKIRDEFKMQVLDIIAKEYISQGYKVDIFQSRLSDSGYELNFEQIDIPI